MIREYGTICIELSGTDLTVRGLREWLAKVDAANVPENTQLDINGAILRVVLRRPVVEPTHCGDCAPSTEHIGHTLWDRDCRQSD